MTNHQAGRRILEFARDFALRNMRAARRAGIPAGVVRAAQEVVELALKAAIRELGADYPKVHDPAAGFVAVALAAEVALTPGEARRLMAESRRLAEQRGPAFYQEADVSDDDAARAAEAAEWVWALIGERVFPGFPLAPKE